MIRITIDNGYRIEVDGELLERCEEVVQGENYDERKATLKHWTYEYSGDYKIIPVGENVKLIIG